MKHSKKFTVLLVEDNPGDIRLIEEALKNRPCEVHLKTVRDGEMALKFLNQEAPFSNVPPPNLILLDLNLPRLNGLEVLSQLKSHPVHRCIPIIVLTSSQAHEDVQTAYHHHANCYIVKPSQLNDFFRTIDAIETFWFQEVSLPT